MKLQLAILAFLAAATAHACPAGSTTKGDVTIAGHDVAYEATAGYLEVTAQDQKSKACIFYVSYKATNASARPLAFAFNGGPGSASHLLHLGILGPKRLNLSPDGLSAAPGDALIANDLSLLDQTDLVLIDAPFTGYTFTTSDNAFLGAYNDAVAFGEFVANYISLTSSTAPIFLIGESYGGMRASLVANYLQKIKHHKVAGLALLAPGLSFEPLDFGTSSQPHDLAYWTFFPSYVTTAWYHHKLSAALQALDVATIFARARTFANTTYRQALGQTLTAAQKKMIQQKMSELTGLAPQKFANLRMNPFTFVNEVLQQPGQTLGRYDTRAVGTTKLPYTEANWKDPSLGGGDQLAASAIVPYLLQTLGFQSARTYVTLAPIPSWPAPENNPYITATADLSEAMTENPNMKVWIGAGYYDTACPIGAIEYELSQMEHVRDLLPRITLHDFPSGHMLYLNPAILGELHSELAHLLNP